MSIDNSTVKKVAILARIEVQKDEEDKLIQELNNILGWVDELRELGGHEKLRKSGASQSKLLKAREKIEDLLIRPSSKSLFYLPFT